MMENPDQKGRNLTSEPMNTKAQPPLALQPRLLPALRHPHPAVLLHQQLQTVTLPLAVQPLGHLLVVSLLLLLRQLRGALSRLLPWYLPELILVKIISIG